MNHPARVVEGIEALIRSGDEWRQLAEQATAVAKESADKLVFWRKIAALGVGYVTGDVISMVWRMVA